MNLTTWLALLPSVVDPSVEFAHSRSDYARPDGFSRVVSSYRACVPSSWSCVRWRFR